MPPGSLVHIGDQRVSSVKLTVIDYNEQHVEEKEVKTVAECCTYRDKPSVTWLNVGGVHDPSVIEGVGAGYGLHQLLMEDVLNTDQRPKLEDYDNHIFIVLKMLQYDETAGEVQSEQVSFVLGENFVISFQENGFDVFEGVRDSIRNFKGKIRKVGADYLCYALLDAIIDQYFVILEKLGDKVDDLEDELIASPSRATLQAIHKMRREFLFLRKSIWPLREVLSALQRDGNNLVRPPTMMFIRDVYDHTVQIVENVETYREILSGMLDIYLSSLSNRMNEVMKVLTIIATIFIPLTFIAGVYGMNFDVMPELRSPYGYPAVWGVMLTLALIMLAFFKKNKWL